MRILGKHRQSFDLIRSLAITSHALDLSAETLLVSGTYNNKHSETEQAYDELLSTNLLHLAVAIRTNIYQGLPPGDTNAYISHCGFLDVVSNGKPETRTFSIKDVCNKIIHADEIHRELRESPEGARTVTVITGVYNQKRWKLFVSVELFCEAVLNWLDDIGQSQPCNAPSGDFRCSTDMEEQ